MACNLPGKCVLLGKRCTLPEVVFMKNPNEVLRQKEEDLARVRREIESLQLVSSLLSDELTSDEQSKKKESVGEKEIDPDISSEATGTDGLFSATAAPRSSFWKVLTRA